MSDVHGASYGENRLLAALARDSAVMEGLELVCTAPREKSRYATVRAIQAVTFRVANMVLIGMLWVMWGITFALSIGGMIGMHGGAEKR